MKNKRKTLDQLISHFGVERILHALPQREVCSALELVSVQELADELEVGYDALRSQMQSGKIPFPDVRLVRRAFFTKDQAQTIISNVRKLK